MHKSKIILSFFMMIFLVTACEEKMSFEEILTSSECSAPCWMDIKPGKTTKDEVLFKLNDLPALVNADSIFTEIYGGNERIGWKFLNSDVYGDIGFKDGYVSSISIGYNFGEIRKSGLKFGRLIELYGSPSDIYYQRGIGDLGIILVNLVNLEKGIEYGFNQAETEKLIVSPDQIVYWVLFFSPGDTSEVVLPSFDWETDKLENHHFEWSGFTEIPLPQP